MDYLDKAIPNPPPPSQTEDEGVVRHGERLLYALETARAARALIEPAQAVLRAQPYKDSSEAEKEARAYQLELIEKQLNRAADLAEKRLAHLATIQTQEDADAENAKCANGLEGCLYWFEHYAWGYDPRPTAPLNDMPLGLFEFQERYVAWLFNLIFERRQSGLTEKARDMGATVVALLFFVWCWLYVAGFAALLSSRNEVLVDSAKDPDSLFEKLRFTIRLLPLWMRPAGFNADKIPFGMVANPANGATISGSAPTSGVGRGGRKTVVLFDEFQKYPQSGYPQYTASSQTTLSIIALGTPEGRFNKYADLRHDGHIAVFEMDWRLHPWKDKRWYQALPHGYAGPAMSEEQIAQEIDRNYEASQPGRVFRFISEPHLFITWSELVEGFRRAGADTSAFYHTDGGYRVPPDWKWTRTFDYGQTEGHPWIYTNAARPRVAWKFHDTVFVFTTHRITPTGAETRQAFWQWREIEARLGWRDPHTWAWRVKPHRSECSHEAADERSTLLKEHGDNWRAWETDYTLGLAQMNEWFALVDSDKPNPFRPELYGRARIVFVADDGEYSLAFNETAGTHFVTASATEKGHKLLREELPSYHYPEEERGKPLAKMRPLKIKDDVIDNLRAIATRWGPSVGQLTEDEEVMKRVREDVRPAAIAATEDPDEKARKFRQLARQMTDATRQIRAEKQAGGNPAWDVE